jgi:hypothetical protein
MNKTSSLTVAMMLAVSTFFGQTPITITTSNMPGANDTIRYSSVNPASVDITQTGPNFTWKYDTLKATGQGRYDYKSALSTVYAFYFFGTNQYGLKVADSIGTAPYKFYNVYNFYKNTAATFVAEGIGFTYSGTPLAAYYSDVDEIYTFPVHYTGYDSTTYAFSVSLGTGTSYSQKGYRINYVDGWGKIKTPYDSANCIRLVSTTIGIDSINYSGFGYSFPDQQRSYKWMVTTEKIPFLEVHGTYNSNTFTPTWARYRDTYRTFAGINELANTTSMLVYPNPAVNELNISSTDKNASTVEVTDLTGKPVMNEKIESGKAKFNTSQLAAGMYIYRIYDTQQRSLKLGKVIISR